MPVVHSVDLSMGVSSAVAVGKIVVTHPSELRDALAQRERPVLIEDRKLARWFQNLEFWRTVRLGIIATMIAWAIQQSIAHKYNIDVSLLYHWKTETIEGKVILSPPK